jgi:hypothetical protein
MKMKDVAVDSARAEAGDWVDEIQDMEGLRIKSRGSQNRDWRRLQSKLIQAVPRKKRMNGTLDPEEADRITSLCLLNTGVLDWDGLEDDDGNPIPYSRDMAEKLLTDPDYRRFRDAAVYAANKVADDNAEDRKEDVGNLLRLSHGNTATEGRKLKAS